MRVVSALNRPFIAGSSKDRLSGRLGVWRPGAVHQFVRNVVLDGGMRNKVAKTVGLVVMALALGLVLGAVTKFGLGHDFAVAVEASSASAIAAQ
jgi:hypothetical protein